MTTEAHKVATILLAEDDADDRMLALRALKQAHLANEVKTVADGEELMDYLHRRGAYADPTAAPRPDLILLDLNMPRKDGREALQEIKQHPQLRSIPVVILTTSSAEVDVLRSYETGVNAYISKPVSFAELSQAMQSIGDFWFRIVRLPQPN